MDGGRRHTRVLLKVGVGWLGAEFLEALSKAGCDDLGEFLREGSDEANELLEKLKKLGERDSLRKSCTNRA